MDWTDYQTYDVIMDYTEELQKSFSSQVFLNDIGNTTAGRTLRIVGFCSSGTCGEKPAMWLDSGTHAREWTSVSSLTYVMNELINNQEKYGEIVDELDWYFMPIVNPDGYVYSMEHDSNWRTNRAKHSKCIGVDINRNFPLNWAESECGDTYAGPEAFSEIESREIATFIKEHLESIKFYNSLHCYGELILFPWASTKNKFQTEASHYELGKKGLKAITLSSGHGYKIGSAAKVLYTAKGSSIDYFTKIGIPYVYAMEIGTAFIPNVKEILPLAKDVLGFHVSIAEEIIEEFS
uniref:Carboxypeptidase B n=1 Tax=Lepeophtheirus salmonis TaxID=72036 RepID=C1BTN0_LEPSM|nr:Carboxypeptidase B [Lepeophtheirus salmonis]